MKNNTPDILVMNGVNLDLLGQRQPDIYGSFSLSDLESLLMKESTALATACGLMGVNLSFYQSNAEAEFIEKLTKVKVDGVLINPAAWTHTSLALADRLAAMPTPYVEVHISNLAVREDYRQKSYSAPHALGVVYGFGLDSYLVGLTGLLRHLGNASG